MAGPALKHNRVYFKADFGGGVSQRTPLQLAGAWKYSAGVKPNNNAALIPWTEWETLVSNAANPDLTGDIEFWFNSTPEAGGSPDVTLAGWRITEARASRIGIPVGQIYPRVVEYHVFFSDFRTQFVAPRGGRLMLGLLNAGPKPASSSDQQADDAKAPAETGSAGPQVPEASLSDLIIACLRTMGPNAATNLPESVASMDAPRDLKWFGNHAPSELEKLLEIAGCVYCPNTSGSGQVFSIQTSGTPNITGSPTVLPEIQLPDIDRRGKTVVFSSFPYPNAETITLAGPRDDQWQFVIQDSKGKWQTPANCDLFKNNGGLLKQWQNHFKDVPEANRATAAGQAYRYIRLGDGSNPPTGTNPNDTLPMPAAMANPVQHGITNPDGTITDIQVTAQVAIKDPQTGIYQNSKDLIGIAASFKSDQNVIQLNNTLIQVSQPSADPFTFAQEVPAGKIQVTFTRTQSTQDSGGKWHPQFFHLGFQMTNGQASQLSDQDTENAVGGRGQDAVIFACGEAMRLRFYKDSPYNKQQLTDTAKGWAAELLAGSANPTRVIQVVGFASCAIDGYVTQVEWDQAKCMTTIVCNNWYRPLGALSAETLRAAEDASDLYPLQDETQERRTATNEPGATQPIVPLNPTPPPPEVNYPDMLVQVGAFIGAGVYNGTIQTGSIDDEQTATDLTMANEGLSNGASCMLLVTEEDAANVDAFGNAYKGGQRLAAGSYVLGQLRGMSNEGTPRPIVVVRGGVGSMASPGLINPSPTQTTADNTLWTRAGATTGSSGTILKGAVNLYVMCRAPVWDGTNNQWDGFQRQLSFDARGLIYRIGPEEKIIFTGTTNCT